MFFRYQVGKDKIKEDNTQQYTCIIDQTRLQALPLDDTHLGDFAKVREKNFCS